MQMANERQFNESLVTVSVALLILYNVQRFLIVGA